MEPCSVHTGMGHTVTHLSQAWACRRLRSTAEHVDEEIMRLPLWAQSWQNSLMLPVIWTWILMVLTVWTRSQVHKHIQWSWHGTTTRQINGSDIFPWVNVLEVKCHVRAFWVPRGEQGKGAGAWTRNSTRTTAKFAFRRRTRRRLKQVRRFGHGGGVGVTAQPGGRWHRAQCRIY